MAGPCDIPVLGEACGVAGDAFSSAAESAFDAAAQRVAEGFAKATEFALTFWTDVELPTLSQSSGPVAALQSSFQWYSVWIAIGALLIAAGKIVVTASARPARDAIRGLLTWVLVAGAGVAAINAAAVGTDAFSVWIIDRSTGGDFGSVMAKIALISTASGISPGLGLLVGFVGILASLAQMALMIVRVGVVTIVAGLLPLAAAGSGTEAGRAWFNRMLAWVIAYLLYKPAAAVVYASAFFLIGEGEDAVSVLSGLFLMMLSILALPALMRLVTPVVAAATSSGSGGAAAGAGMAVATGARVLADRGSSSSAGSSGSAGGGPSGSRAGLVRAGGGGGSGGGPSGSSSAGRAAGAAGRGATSGAASEAASGAGAAAAGAAAAPVAVVAKGAQLASAGAKSAAASSTSGGATGT